MSFYFIEIDQKLNWSLNSNFEEELGNSLGGLRFGIDAEGNYGYKEVGADTVIPFRNSDIIWSNDISTSAGEGTANNLTITIKKPKKSDKVLLLAVANSGINSYSISDGIAALSLLYSNKYTYTSNLCLWSISNIQTETVTILINKSDTGALHRLVFQATE